MAAVVRGLRAVMRQEHFEFLELLDSMMRIFTAVQTGYLFVRLHPNFLVGIPSLRPNVDRLHFVYCSCVLLQNCGPCICGPLQC